MNEYLLESLWSPATAFKILLVLVTYPLWSPVLRVMWKQTKGAFEVMDVQRGDDRQIVHRPPGEDPWFHIPRGDRRRGQGRSVPRGDSAPSRSAPGGRAPARRPTRRTGF